MLIVTHLCTNQKQLTRKQTKELLDLEKNHRKKASELKWKHEKETQEVGVDQMEEDEDLIGRC